MRNIISMFQPQHKDLISRFMAHVHSSVREMSACYYQNERRYSYATPRSFLEQISLFKSLLKRKREEVQQRKEHLGNGIQKLRTTASQVRPERQGASFWGKPLLAHRRKQGFLFLVFFSWHFWDYRIITTFSPSLFSLQILPHPPSYPLPLFSLLLHIYF